MKNNCLLRAATVAMMVGRIATSSCVAQNRQHDTEQLSGLACEAGQAYAKRDATSDG